MRVRQEERKHVHMLSCFVRDLEKAAVGFDVDNCDEVERGRPVMVLGIHVRTMLDKYLSEFHVSATRRAAEIEIQGVT